MSPSSRFLRRRARRLLAKRLTPKSYQHCERVAAEAARLARRFGVDPYDAELAGLLHDYARDESDERLLELADELGVPVLPFEAAHPYLIHAQVGAALARRDLPGVNDAVVSAITAHTIGVVSMPDLDRVVYLADMIEPARDFPGVEALREACERETLSECFRLGYGRSVRHVVEKGKPAHPLSAAVGDDIESETGRGLFDGLDHHLVDVDDDAPLGTGDGTQSSEPEPVETGAAQCEEQSDQAAPEDGLAEDEPAADASPSADDADAVIDEEPDASHSVSTDDEGPDDDAHRIRRVRRRRAGRGHIDPVEQEPAQASEDGHHRHAHRSGALPDAGSLARRVVKFAFVGLLAAAMVAGAMAGLVLGINAFARWNAIRIAGSGPVPTSPEENNLLVIGVQDGVATGFTALKMERSSDRVLGIAIPDGAFVEVPGQGFERIGSSYITGPEVSKDTVSNYLGVTFPRYAVVDGDTYQSLLASQDVAGLMNQVTQTDLTEDERASFATYLGAVNPKNVWIVPLPVKPVAVGDQKYYEPQRSQVADLLLQWWGVKASEQKTTPRVIVYNGVGTPGLAGLASQQLIRTGFRIVNSGNADNFDYPTTHIYLYHGTRADAQAVRDALGVGEVIVQSAPQELTDMIVIIGADYRPPVKDGSTVPTEGVQ